MDVKKAIQGFQQMNLIPFILCIGNFEFRVVYEIKELKDDSAILVTSLPIDRETADAVLKGQTNPNWIDEDTGKREQILHQIGYSEITYIDGRGNR